MTIKLADLTSYSVYEMDAGGLESWIPDQVGNDGVFLLGRWCTGFPIKVGNDGVFLLGDWSLGFPIRSRMTD